MPGRFDPDKYDTVQSRLEKFWEAHPNGAILTSMESVTPDHKSVVIRAEAWFDKADTRPAGSGIAQELAGGNGANATHHVENAETSAIGRALANCGYSGDLRPSLEEMQKIERPAYQNRGGGNQGSGNNSSNGSQRPPQVAVNTAEGEIRDCFNCHAPVRFATVKGKMDRFNADGGLHFKTCGKGATGYESSTPATAGLSDRDAPGR